MIPERASRLRLYLNASDRWQGRPLYQAVVERARALGLAGASVFPADLSFGTHHELRDSASDYAFFDVPVVVEIIDGHDQIAPLLAELRAMVAEGLATLDPVRVVHYSHVGSGGA
jgi:PII-like signaling protein